MEDAIRLRQLTRHSINPFVNQKLLEIGKYHDDLNDLTTTMVSTTKNKSGKVVDKKETTSKPKRIKDRRRFKKFFGVGQFRLSKMSFSAMRIYFYIQEKINKQEDTVSLKTKTLAEFYEVSNQSTFVDGILELIKISVIAPTTTNTIYYFDPDIIYNGDWSKQAALKRQEEWDRESQYREQITVEQTEETKVTKKITLDRWRDVWDK